MDTSVLIIGAGPTGLMLALELSLLKIPFRIIDANVTARPFYQSRALVVHSRTLELLARHDLAERFISTGSFSHEAHIFLNRSLLWKMKNTRNLMGDTIYPDSATVIQPLAEKFLEERLVEYGGTIEKGVIAERIVTDEDGEGVSVWIRCKKLAPENPKNYEEKEDLIRCKYVVGCDGMHSMVRTSAGINFKGTSYTEEFILADAQVEWSNQKGTYFFIDRGFMAFLPLGDKDLYRIVCRRPSSNKSLLSAFWTTPTTMRSREPSIYEFNDSIAALVPGSALIHNPTWLSTFRINSRLASTYNVGRLFLAGDAAHVHAPVGGQGMNSGIQDAVNLGWKLARVLHSTASTTLLSSYEIERRKIAKVTVHSTEIMFNVMSTTNLFKIWVRNFIWRWILPYFGDPNSADKIRRRLSQLSIRYRHSPIVNTAPGWRGKLRGGDRAPDGWLVNTRGDHVTLQGICKKPADYLILFSSDKSLDFLMDDIQWLKDRYLDLVVLCICNNKIIEGMKSIDSYADPEGRLHTLYEFDKPSYVLIRPDGYISNIGPLSLFEELRQWMNTQTQYKNDVE
ncbi:putative aromatic compound monooxygenase YhjG [Erysiphe neolycopersici]|uniref:Putative aromatic compound monooxygenase YhjG n=1 Tax=Erysiphe neolycopersici TaxID=212602 RepID=A0A420HL19_9PEZI|nr:putative aromatic compound monooxygenase YhjG [Erysiphe neolycopersici]